MRDWIGTESQLGCHQVIGKLRVTDLEKYVTTMLYRYLLIAGLCLPHVVGLESSDPQCVHLDGGGNLALTVGTRMTRLTKVNGISFSVAISLRT